jgi:hypothetical protein
MMKKTLLAAVYTALALMAATTNVAANETLKATRQVDVQQVDRMISDKAVFAFDRNTVAYGFSQPSLKYVLVQPTVAAPEVVLIVVKADHFFGKKSDIGTAIVDQVAVRQVAPVSDVAYAPTITPIAVFSGTGNRAVGGLPLGAGIAFLS